MRVLTALAALALVIAAPAAVGTAHAAAPAAAPAAVTVGDDQDHKAVTLHQGDTLTVTLGSTAWVIDAARSPVLTTAGEQVVKVTRPGPGAPGTVSRSFTAASAGDTTVTASRTSCGEALKCNDEQAAYVVTVHVAAAVPVLPRTGAATDVAAALGVLLLLAGGGAVLAGRKRPTAA